MRQAFPFPFRLLRQKKKSCSCASFFRFRCSTSAALLQPRTPLLAVPLSLLFSLAFSASAIADRVTARAPMNDARSRKTGDRA